MTHSHFSNHAGAAQGSADENISHASVIIERFGGIRPMASKLGAPVTTVQGWKKRGVIPGNRRAEIAAAATQHGIEIADLLGAGANENGAVDASVTPRVTPGVAPSAVPGFAQREEKSDFDAMKFADRLEEAQTQAHTPENPKASSPRIMAAGPASGANHAPDEAKLKILLKSTEQRAVTKSAITTVILCLLAAGAVAALILPLRINAPAGDAKATQEAEAKIQALESKIAALEARQSDLSQIVPSDLGEKIASLEEQTRDVRESMGAALVRAQSVATKALGGSESLEALGQQAAGQAMATGAQLGAQAVAMAQAWNIEGTLAQWRAMAQSPQGEAMLGDAMKALLAALETPAQGEASDNGMSEAGADEALPGTLEAARAQEPALAKVFEGVPSKDLEAAAYLLALTQVRESLSRDDRPFAQDLAVLQRLLGDGDPELAAALARLSPQAEKGVLTPSGLSEELRRQTGDILAASLSGEDVSITERARASLGNVLQIEKNGEPVTGTQTQKTVSQAQNLIDQGNIPGALAMMETLEGPAAQQASLWIARAKSGLLAQQIKTMVQGAIQESANQARAVSGVTH